MHNGGMPRRRKTMIALTGELDATLQPWTCPQCRKRYHPPVTTYISPLDGRERCATCADGNRTA
jgi:hypothetical protein